MAYTLYVAVSEISGKCYVGQTKETVEVRRAQHEKASRQKKAKGVFTQALRKHGFDAFTWWAIDTVDTVEEANAREQALIEEFDCLAPRGYNLDQGGRNRIVHPDTKRRISEARKGLPCPFAGRRHTEETKEKMSLAQRGRKKSKEAIEKMRLALKGRKGVEHSEETRAQIALAQPHRRTFVLQNRDTLEIRVFESIADAIRQTGFSRAGLSKVASGIQKSIFGWVLFQP